MRSKGFATKCYQAGKVERCKYLKLVDLAGIEPATSSMPWNVENLALCRNLNK